MKIKATIIFLFLSILTYSQSPEKFTYQSIIKNSSGYLLKNQEVGLRISILFNSSNGAEVYSEEHFPTSNSNGLVTVIIGEGLTGDNISDVDWGNGEYFLKVEVDPDGGINYSMNQTSQLLSVPYALYAENSKLNLLGQDFITLADQTLTVNKVDLTDDVDGVLPITNGGTGSDTAPMVGVITAADEAAARSALGLGTAATTASTDYATAAQGALADTALQDATAFATAAQGVKADSAQQPPVEGAFVDGDKTKLDGIEALADVTDTANVTTAGALMDSEVTNLAEVKAFDSTDYATAAQGVKADSAQQPPVEGAFVDGDKTKLDGIEALADARITNALIDEDNMASDSDTKLPSQQSVKAYVDSAIPVGGIILWSGSIDSIPSNWQLCNGTNSTPDLRDRFIVGAGDNYSVDAVGGSNSNNITTTTVDNDAFASTISVVNGANSDNRPPYYALAFIMRIQ
ncbi:hypothetical protein N9L37_01265 [Flavobacteriaceae bacterium]|nr:hypothetical protein [Flavobacteriaceae bacterium]